MRQRVKNTLKIHVAIKIENSREFKQNVIEHSLSNIEKY